MNPGIYPNLTMDEYHAIDACSASRLNLLSARSLAHVRYDIDNRPESTDEQEFGTACHLAILEPGRFSDRYYAIPEGDGRTKAVKDARELAEIDNPGKTGLKKYSECRGVATRVSENLEARVYLEAPGEFELSLVWNHEGLLCKARLDKLCRSIKVIVDVKTTDNASPAAFARTIANLGYHRQAAWYLDACAALGLPASYYELIAVERDEPHESCVYRLSDMAIDLGREQNARLRSEYARAVRTGKWTGYPQTDGGTIIDLPDWAYKGAM